MPTFLANITKILSTRISSILMMSSSQYMYMYLCLKSDCSFTNYISLCLNTKYFYTPVFRRDVLWYGYVCPGILPSVRSSITVSRTFSLHALTYNLKFSMSHTSYEHSSKFECRQFPLIFVGIMPLLGLLNHPFWLQLV